MAVVPAVADFAGGTLATTTANAFIRDPLKFLMKPPGAQARQATLQSIANNSATAYLTFDAEDWDDDPFGTGTHHDNVTNNSRITIAYAGKYRLSGGVTYAANATGRRGLLWAVNGTLVPGGETAFAAAVNVQNTSVSARTIEITLSVGDYVQLAAFQDSGGALNTAVASQEQATMTARWVALT